MDQDKFETLPPDVAHRLTKPSHLGRSRDKKGKFSSSTYMGVFYSPKVPGRRRRVDLKFYPMREKAFAQLYFTGNGHFNRSMRLWATRKFHWTLSDHVLFYRNTTTRVMDATDERQVFDRLGLAWKEPEERDGYDAVISKESGETASQLKGLTQAELNRESQEAWIE